MNRRRWLLLALIGACVAVLGWCRLAGRDAPAGQPALAHLDPASLAMLRADFNRAAGEVRIVVLLSPT